MTNMMHYTYRRNLKIYTNSKHDKDRKIIFLMQIGSMIHPVNTQRIYKNIFQRLIEYIMTNQTKELGLEKLEQQQH